MGPGRKGVGSPSTQASWPAQAAATAGLSGDEEALLHGQVELTPALARVCSEFVSPDRGVHTETEALSGAMRTLSDRLGRDTRLRGLLRRMLGIERDMGRRRDGPRRARPRRGRATPR